MLEDKFKLTRANITLIVINCILVVFVILAAVQLIFSLKDKSGEIPELKTTAGKSSTLVADGTSTTSIETTTTITKKIGNENSPYYNIDIYSILNKDLLEKENISKEEKIELGKQFLTILDGILNPSNDDLINVSYLLTKVKPGEKDKISVNGKDYGIIYNSEEFLKSIMSDNMIYKLKEYTINEIPVVYYNEENREYYKISGDNKINNYKIINYEYQNVGQREYSLKIIYTNPDEKASSYKSAFVKLQYTYTKNCWEISDFNFPYED